MARTSREFGVRLVISGHRFPPLAYPLTSFTADTADQNTVCVSPLLASRIQEADQLSLVMSMGWKKLAIAGNTSNCKLIGVVEESMFDRLGYNPHIYEVSKEIRGGIYDRAWGVKKVEKPTITPDHRQWVMERMA
ncbi:hypothetical protein CDN98_04855 [Roseateles terrae]|nr:hypothetical protein CDN98_04855 [Roseateles terrae]